MSLSYTSGGDLLSQGGFGCVFHPALLCSGKEEKTLNNISKIVEKNDESMNEVDIGDIVKKIKDYNLFFIPVDTYCNVDIEKIKLDDMSKCDITKNKKEQYMLLRMPYVRSDKFGSQNMKYVIRTYDYLLNSINKLLKAGVVHFDLKSENILYDRTLEVPLIIDFGISIPLKNIDYKQHFYVHSPSYYIWPLEAHLITLIVNHNDREEDSIKYMVETFVKNNRALQRYSKSFLEKYKKSCYSFIDRILSFPKNEQLTVLTSYMNTWDNYAISIMYLQMINPVNNDFYKKLVTLLTLNIHPDPEKRLTIIETKDKLQRIFVNLAIENIIL